MYVRERDKELGKSNKIISATYEQLLLNSQHLIEITIWRIFEIKIDISRSKSFRKPSFCEVSQPLVQTRGGGVRARNETLLLSFVHA